MFKHYLTYNFALSFHRSCCALEVSTSWSTARKERLLRSTETMLHHFAKSIRESERSEEFKALCVALICTRDCREILKEAELLQGPLDAQSEILVQRLEQICLGLADSEGGQFSMFG